MDYSPSSRPTFYANMEPRADDDRPYISHAHAIPCSTQEYIQTVSSETQQNLPLQLQQRRTTPYVPLHVSHYQDRWLHTAFSDFSAASAEVERDYNSRSSSVLLFSHSAAPTHSTRTQGSRTNVVDINYGSHRNHSYSPISPGLTSASTSLLYSNSSPDHLKQEEEGAVSLSSIPFSSSSSSNITPLAYREKRLSLNPLSPTTPASASPFLSREAGSQGLPVARYSLTRPEHSSEDTTSPLSSFPSRWQPEMYGGESNASLLSQSSNGIDTLHQSRNDYDLGNGSYGFNCEMNNESYSVEPVSENLYAYGHMNNGINEQPGSSDNFSAHPHSRTSSLDMDNCAADAGISGPRGATSKKPRTKERQRIELAPDQPPTTQGKQRERVYVACQQCRSRKIRCDGAKPMCYNCRQRNTDACEYDAVPKRRGPDRVAGARQRHRTGKPLLLQAEKGPKQRRLKTNRDKDEMESSYIYESVDVPSLVDSREKIQRYSSGLASISYDAYQHTRFEGQHISNLTTLPRIETDNGSTLTMAPLSSISSRTSGTDSCSPVPLWDAYDAVGGYRQHGRPNLIRPFTTQQLSSLPHTTTTSLNPNFQIPCGSNRNRDSYASIDSLTSLESTGSPDSASYSEFHRPPFPLPVHCEEYEECTHKPIVVGQDTSNYEELMKSAQIGQNADINLRLSFPEYPLLNTTTVNCLPKISKHSSRDIHSLLQSQDPLSANELSPEKFVQQNLETYTSLSSDTLNPWASYNPYQWSIYENNESGQETAYITETETSGSRCTPLNIGFTQTPSLAFVRQTWWDSLIDTYCSVQYCSPKVRTHLSKIYNMDLPCTSYGPTRFQVTQVIVRDLQALFRFSNAWFAFINVPRFFETFWRERETMQPALVLAILMFSNFFRSNTMELGSEGLKRTMWLREKAQAAMDASIAASWIDAGLAQAAWLLSVFEISAHPKRGFLRINSAMATLDNIIRFLSLTFIDAEESTTVHERPENGLPYNLGQLGCTSHIIPSPLYSRRPIKDGILRRNRHASQLLHHAPQQVKTGSCPCNNLNLGRHWDDASKYVPFWTFTPAWNPAWTDAEIRKEECRRLCWNTLLVIAGYTSYRAAVGLDIFKMFLLDSSNFRNVLPGENLVNKPYFSGSVYDVQQQGTETVWALYARATLLWHSCLRIQGVSDQERSIFAQAVWLEADAIEDALNGHSCVTERAFLYQGREYLFNARMYVSYGFRRFVPHPSPDMSGGVHRIKAEEWLTHQATLAKRVMQGLQTVCGIPGTMMAKRPFFQFWFMGQIARCLQLWSMDKSLTFAVELAKHFIPPIDYLTALWPCVEQRTQYIQIRKNLDVACREAGIVPPPPVDINFPLPSSLTSAALP